MIRKYEEASLLFPSRLRISSEIRLSQYLHDRLEASTKECNRRAVTPPEHHHLLQAEFWYSRDQAPNHSREVSLKPLSRN